MVSRAPVHLYRTETQVGLLKVLEMVPCTFSIIGSEITLAFQWIGGLASSYRLYTAL